MNTRTRELLRQTVTAWTEGADHGAWKSLIQEILAELEKPEQTH